MSIRAVGVNNGTIPGISRFVIGKTRDIYYIGGSDVLPAPLEPQREAFVLSKLGTDKEQEAIALNRTQSAPCCLYCKEVR